MRVARAALLVAALLVHAVAWGQEFTLKLQHFLSARSVAHTRVIQPWCDRLAKDSGGRLKCRIGPDMQFGGEPAELVDQARTGMLDVAYAAIGLAPGRFPRTEVFELPFMADDPEHTARALWAFSQGPAAAEYRDVRLLAIHPQGRAVLHNTRRAVTGVADLKDLRLRVPSRVTRDALNAMRAQAVGMPLRQVPAALSMGMLDGVLATYDGMVEAGVPGNAKFHSETAAGTPALSVAVHVLVMSPATWERLPADLKRVVETASGAGLSVAAARAHAEADAAARKAVAKDSFNTIPAPAVEEMRKAVQPVADAWAKQAGKAGVDAKAVMAAARKALAAAPR
jgi:TRAP-type C4-dicarboxylate transport system substrate-binding protein